MKKSSQKSHQGDYGNHCCKTDLYNNFLRSQTTPEQEEDGKPGRQCPLWGVSASFDILIP